MTSRAFIPVVSLAHRRPQLRVLPDPADPTATGVAESLQLWIQYWYQIDSIVRSGAQTILQLGLGSGVVTRYLQQRLDLSVTTVDDDARRNPDVVANLKDLDEYFHPNQFDAVGAFQILAMLPFKDFVPAVRQLSRVSRSRLILSFPHRGPNLGWRLRIRNWTCGFGRTRSHAANGESSWELGTEGQSVGKIRQLLETVVDIDQEYFCPDDPSVYFFECRRRPEAGPFQPALL